MADAYQAIARKILKARGRPMSAREILEEAQKYGLLPDHLHGATMHKTLQARLSEDIIANRFKSPFYRTNPGVFFLRELAQDPSIGDLPLDEFPAQRRQKPLRRQRILCLPAKLLSNLPRFTERFQPFISRFASPSAVYLRKDVADQKRGLARLLTFTVMRRRSEVLEHLAGRYTEHPGIVGRRSIGFRSYISEFDIDLLNDDPIGVRRNSARELLRYIILEDDKITDYDIIKRITIIGALNSNGQVALILDFNIDQFPATIRQKNKPLHLNNPQWIALDELDSVNLEEWSQAALKLMRNDR